MEILVFEGNEVTSGLIKKLASTGENVTVVSKEGGAAMGLEEAGCEVIQAKHSTLGVIASICERGVDAIVCGSANSEKNIIYCEFARKAFGVPIRIARVDKREYFPSEGVMPIGVFNSLKDSAYMIQTSDLIGSQISCSSRIKSAAKVSQMLDYKFSFVEMKAKNKKGEGKNVTKEDLKQLGVKVIGIARGANFMPPEREEEIAEGDKLYLLIPESKIITTSGVVTGDYSVPGSGLCVIGGGGKSAGIVASSISRIRPFSYISIIEEDEQTAQEIAEIYPGIEVINGSIKNWSTLENVNIQQADLYIAMSKDEIHNEASAVAAKQMGCKQVVSVMKGTWNKEGIGRGEIDQIVEIGTVFANRAMAIIYASEETKMQTFFKNQRFCAEVKAKDLSKYGQNNRGCVGLTIGTIEQEAGITVEIAQHKGMHFWPAKDYIVQASDRMIITGQASQLARVKSRIF